MGEFGCLEVAAVRSGTTVLELWNFRSCSCSVGITLQQPASPKAALLPSIILQALASGIQHQCLCKKKDKMDKYFAYCDLNWLLLLISAWFYLLYLKYEQ